MRYLLPVLVVLLVGCGQAKPLRVLDEPELFGMVMPITGTISAITYKDGQGVKMTRTFSQPIDVAEDDSMMFTPDADGRWLVTLERDGVEVVRTMAGLPVVETTP